MAAKKKSELTVKELSEYINRASDAVNARIIQVEDDLASLGLGVSAFAEIGPYRVQYGRACGKWCLHVSGLPLRNCSRESLIQFLECDCPRKIREAVIGEDKKLSLQMMALGL